MGVVLTSEVLSQAEKQSHSLVVVITWAAGSTQHQGFSSWSSRSSKDTIYICAFYNLPRRGDSTKNKVMKYS